MKHLLTLLFLYTIPSESVLGFELMKKQKDEMNDVITQSIFTLSENTIFASQRDMLVIRRDCNTESVEIFISTNWIVSDPYILYRYDKNQPETVRSSLSNNSKAFFFNAPETHLEQLKKSNTLVVRYQQSGGSTVTPVFSLKGFSAKYKGICK